MKVAIVASGHGRYEAPLGDPAWECWGLNQTWQWFNHELFNKQFSRWFELHRAGFLRWENEKDRYGSHFTFLQGSDRPKLYVQDVEEWPGVKNIAEFPFESVQAIAPDFGYYHACSIDWMIAYAIHEGATEIGLFGVEQDHSGEPIGSRACVEFWAGYATAKGIKVTSVDGSTFKLAHLVYTSIPYALDPMWLPFEDRTSSDNSIAKNRRKLREVMEDDQVAMDRLRRYNDSIRE